MTRRGRFGACVCACRMPSKLSWFLLPQPLTAFVLFGIAMMYFVGPWHCT